MVPSQPDVLARRLFASPLAPLSLPSPREIHLWYVVPDEVKHASMLNHYMGLLSPCERRSVLSMRGDKLQKGALLARALVRTTLARYTDSRMSPRSLKFRKNKFGKPEVEWQNDRSWIPPPLHFNISHTSSLVACGVSLGVQIGIDVEEKERKLRNDILSFARRCFSPCEVEFLCAFSDPEDQRRELVKLWTLKEAYVKALGRGFSAAPFRDFTIRFESITDMQGSGKFESAASNIVVEAVDNSENLTTNWQFGLFELHNSHYAAVCMETGESIGVGGSYSIKLKAWKTLPCVADESISETDAVVKINCMH